MCVKPQTHPSLQAIPLSQRQCVSLGNDWDDINFTVNGFHELHIQRLETVGDKDWKKGKTENMKLWYKMKAETEEKRI